MPTWEEGKLLSELSTLGIGGPARYFATATTITEMAELIQQCHSQNLPFLIVGKGSNSLFDDRGFDGLVILNKIDHFHQQDGEITVGSGYNFSRLGAQTARDGWAGLEFASGIPGSVGGAIYMNAGANGQETADVLVSVEYLNFLGDSFIYDRDELTFGYRSSIFQHWQGAIVAAVFQLEPSDEARKNQIELIQRRTATQPYGDKSAGCAFRNPPGAAAGALIDQCGLKGLQVGGAAISDVHANFVVNAGDAKAEDVKQLIALVKQKVKESSGVDLQEEIRRVPYNPKEEE